MNRKRYVLIIIFLAILQGCVSNVDLDSRISALEHENIKLKEALEWELFFNVDSVLAQKENYLTIHDIPRDGSWATGPLDAEITIVEFIDLECPYSALATDELYDLYNEYRDKIRIIFKHFPLSFHENALYAHSALMAAGNQGYFWDFRFNITNYYSNLSEENIINLAEVLKLNIVRFKNDIVQNKTTLEVINRDLKLGKSIGVSGTPTFYVNGLKTNNLTAMVEAILSGNDTNSSNMPTEAGCEELN